MSVQPLPSWFEKHCEGPRPRHASAALANKPTDFACVFPCVYDSRPENLHQGLSKRLRRVEMTAGRAIFPSVIAIAIMANVMPETGNVQGKPKLIEKLLEPRRVLDKAFVNANSLPIRVIIVE